MSTKFDLQQALTFAMKSGAISPDESARMGEWSKVDPERLTGNPAALQQCLYWQDQAQKLIESPIIQRAIHAAPVPALAPQKHHNHLEAKGAINRAMSNDTLQGYPQQRSHTYGQQSQPVVTRGPGGYVHVDLTKRPLSQQLTAPVGVYEPQPVLSIKAQLQQIQEEIERVVEKVIRAYQQRQQPKATKSRAKTKQGGRYAEAARLMAQVQRSKTGRSAVVVVEKSAPPAPVFNPAAPDFSLLPPLPLDSSGQPSVNTAIVRARSGLEVHPIVRCSQFHQNQFLAMQRGQR